MFVGLTVVVVASRVSTVSECDQIVVLDEGRVAERGTHAELMAMDGLYVLLSEQQRVEELAGTQSQDFEAGVPA